VGALAPAVAAVPIALPRSSGCGLEAGRGRAVVVVQDAVVVAADVARALAVVLAPPAAELRLPLACGAQQQHRAFPFPGGGGRSSSDWRAVVSTRMVSRIPIPPNGVATFHGATTPTTCRRACSPRCSSPRCSEPGIENFYVKTPQLHEQGNTRRRYAGLSGTARHDARRHARQCFPRPGHEVGRLTSDLKIGTDTYPAGSYVVKLNKPYGRLAKNLPRAAGLSRPGAH